LDRYGSTDSPQTAERTAKACLLVPGPSGDIRRAARLAEVAMDHAAEAGGTRPYFVLASGLAEYRLGHFAAAQKQLRTALAFESKSWNLLVPANLLLAMTLQQLGRGGEALAQLTVARKIFDRDVPTLDKTNEGEWHDLLICRVLRREADTLVYDAGF